MTYAAIIEKLYFAWTAEQQHFMEKAEGYCFFQYGYVDNTLAQPGDTDYANYDSPKVCKQKQN